VKLSSKQSIAAPRERVFAALLDPEVLKKCIPGCEEVTATSTSVFDVHLRIGVAAIKGSYKGQVRVENARPHESFSLVLEGRGLPGFVHAKAAIRLEESGGGTELSSEADATVGGVIAAVGSRLLGAIAKKMSAEFFSRLAEEVESR
jgi:hypothetical protein